MLVKVLGADAKPALAMYSVLHSPYVQGLALDAAARAALSPDDYDVFSAALAVTDSAQKERHKLAHWAWGNSPDLPDALLLANPARVKQRAIDIHLLFNDLKSGRQQETGAVERDADMFSMVEGTFVYTKPDLQRIKAELAEAAAVVFHLEAYLSPMVDDDVATITGGLSMLGTRAHALQQLSSRSRFAEALVHAKAKRNNRRAQP
jgi:hypothetical protein